MENFISLMKAEARKEKRQQVVKDQEVVVLVDYWQEVMDFAVPTQFLTKKDSVVWGGTTWVYSSCSYSVYSC